MTINKKVAVGLSGGVDSSVSAYLLQKQGYEVTGVYLQCWEAKADGCKADEDKKYAVETAAHLGIKFEFIDYIVEYKKRVIDYFYAEYRAGRTPNPDIMCNKEIKFGLFYEWAKNNGFDYLATGHYARVEKHGAYYQLLKGADPGKDQSYFLYRLGQAQLAHVVFPVGGMKKSEVRKIAAAAKLPAATRAESMGICFIGEVDIKKFLEKRINKQKGVVLDTKGNIIGEHDGVWFYTIGQRHGFSITKYFGEPLYVVAKNAQRNELIVGFEKGAYCDAFSAEDVHWISGKLPTTDFNCDIRIRHLGELYKAHVLVESAGSYGNEKLQIKVEEPIFAVAAGQSVVLYQNDVVLGGGIIA